MSGFHLSFQERKNVSHSCLSISFKFDVGTFVVKFLPCLCYDFRTSRKWYNYFPVQVCLNQENMYYCKMVQRSRELLNWSRCVSCFIAPADQILQLTWENNVTDREPFSQLFENPIHPLKIHMVPPFVDENSPTFHLQIHGEETGLFRTMNQINVTFSYARCFHGASLSI